MVGDFGGAGAATERGGNEGGEAIGYWCLFSFMTGEG